MENGPKIRVRGRLEAAAIAGVTLGFGMLLLLCLDVWTPRLLTPSAYGAVGVTGNNGGGGGTDLQPLTNRWTGSNDFASPVLFETAVYMPLLNIGTLSLTNWASFGGAMTNITFGKGLVQSDPAGNMTSSSNYVTAAGTTTFGGVSISIVGTAGQPGQLTLNTGNTNVSLFFNGTNLYTAYDQLTNGSTGLTLPTVLTNIAAAATNNDIFVFSGNTGNQAVPISTSAFYGLEGNGTTNLFAADASTVTRTLMPDKVKILGIYVLASGNPGAVANKVEVFTNGVACASVVNMNNVTTGNDTTHNDVCIAGVEWGVKVTAAAGNAVKWSWALKFQKVP